MVLQHRLEQPKNVPRVQPSKWPTGDTRQHNGITVQHRDSKKLKLTADAPSLCWSHLYTLFPELVTHLPFDFAPPCPLMEEPIESFRIRLLGGRTLDRRKWCWSGPGGPGSADVWGSWVEPGPVRFGAEAGRTGAEPELRPVADGLRISTPSSPFVLRSSLACSPLSSSSQPSGFLDGFLLPSTPIPSLEPGVMLPQHNYTKFVTLGAKRCAKLTSKDDVHCLSTWPPLFVSNPLFSPVKTTPNICISCLEIN